MSSDLGIDRIATPVLVTGANGFLGAHVVKRLVEAGVRPRAFVLAGTPVPAEWRGVVDVIEGDVADASAVRAAAKGCRTILHLAALVTDWATREAHRRVTIGGTENVFEAAAETGARVVLVSSIAVYADRIGTRACDEETGFGAPKGAYSWAKQEQERIAEGFRGRIEWAIVRPGNIYGPGCRPWLHEVVDVLRLRFVPTLVDGGRGNAGLAYVENVADLVLVAAWNPKAVGEAFNAADELPITWRDYLGDVARIAGTSPPRSTPSWLAVPSAHAMERAWKALRLRGRPPVTREALMLVGADNRFPQRKARERLGYSPRVGYREGMKAVEAYWRGVTNA